MQAESPITVACIQMEPKIGEKKANVAHSLDKIADAAGKGARLIVLPELCNSGYVFASRHEAFTLAEPLPNGPTSNTWLEAARQHGAVIVAGICERAGDALYKTAAIVGPDGFTRHSVISILDQHTRRTVKPAVCDIGVGDPRVALRFWGPFRGDRVLRFPATTPRRASSLCVHVGHGS
jgi:predicted amidohydrolase